MHCIWRSSISLPTKVQLYHTYIQPVLLYGSETWTLTRALQDKVDAFDNVFVPYLPHSIHGPRNQRHGKTPSWFTAPAVSVHPGQTASIFWTPGKDGYVTWHHQSTWRLHQRAAQPKDWRRPPGRPSRSLIRTLEADLQPLNLGLNSAWKYTQDREHWKHLMETAMLQLGACSWWWWSVLLRLWTCKIVIFY